MEVVLRYEDIYQSQKAKCKWIKEGDGDTNFFHKVANGKNRKNFISKLNINGEIIEDMVRIKKVAIRFFFNLYSKDRGSRPCSDNLFTDTLVPYDVESLEMTFSQEEINEAAFCMPNDKSPGPDGFTMLFYQECWDFIKQDLLKVFLKF